MKIIIYTKNIEEYKSYTSCGLKEDDKFYNVYKECELVASYSKKIFRKEESNNKIILIQKEDNKGA